MDMNDKNLVPIFDGTNFQAWCRRMTNHLLQKDYEDIVGFDLDTLAPKNTPPMLLTSSIEEKASATKCDRKAKATIEHRLSDSVLSVIGKCSTSYDLYKSLHANYQRTTMAAMVSSLKTLVKTTKEPSESMQSYIGRIQTNAEALKNSGFTLEMIPVAMLLANVGDDYANTNAALDTLDTVSMTKASQMLLNAELSIVTPDPTAITAARAEINLLKAQVAALTTKPQIKNKFTGTPCSIHGPRSTHDDAHCFTQHPELKSAFNNTGISTKLYTAVPVLACTPSTNSNWYIDSGCGQHMDNDNSSMRDYESTQGPMIQMGDDTIISCIGTGTSFVELETGLTELSNVLHVPKLTKKLLSPGQSTRNGIKFWFDGDTCTIFSKERCTPPTGTIIGISSRTKDNMYPLPAAKPSQANFAKTGQDKASWTTWHSRLGHLNHRDMKRLQNDPSIPMEVIGATTPIKLSSCEDCILGKMTRFPFTQSDIVTTRPGELVYSDIEILPVLSIKGQYRYFVSYLDFHTKVAFVYLMRRKSDQLEAFKMFNSDVFRQTGTNINKLETFQTDNDTVYLSRECKQFYQERNINHQTIVPRDSESNGSPERLNRTIMDIERALRAHANLGPEYWEFSVGMALSLMRIRPSSTQSDRKTPFEAWFNRKPKISHLRTFGCDAWYHVPKKLRNKLQFKARRGIFIGYATNQSAYKIWDHVDRKVVFSRTVIFNEDSFTFSRLLQHADSTNLTEFEQSSITQEGVPDDAPEDESEDGKGNPTDRHIENAPPEAETEDEDQDADEGADSTNDDVEQPPPQAITETRHSTRTRTPIDRFVPGKHVHFHIPNDDVLQEATRYALNATLAASSTKPKSIPLLRPSLEGLKASDISVPTTLQEALGCVYGGYWSDALHQEYRNLIHFKTWQLRHIPAGRKAITSKWVFKIKPKADGSIEKFKVRLVIKGFSQRPGIDYSETFSPVAHSESIRLLLALAAHHNYSLRQIDVVGAFLQGNMEEQVFMKQPEGFVEKDKEHMVCELLKALYGLKQAGMIWNKTFNSFLTTTLGFSRVSADPCIYYLREDAHLIIIGIHVDDALMVHNSNPLCDRIVAALRSRFEITDLGEPSRLLGMRISRDENGSINLDQESYVDELLKRFRMQNCSPSKLPHQPGVVLTEAMCPATPADTLAMDNIPYGELIGALNWLAHSTRPDILPAVNALCRFVKNPGPQHWKAGQLVLRYLSATASFGIRFRHGDNDQLVAYVDADFANCPDTRRSITGYVILLAGGPIASKSKLQKSVSTSSVQAEYQGLYDCGREIAWLRQLSRDIGHSQDLPTVVHEDNNGCIALASNNRTDPLSKHIDVKYHYVRELVTNEVISVKKISTHAQVADALTKPINANKFLWCRERMGVTNLSPTHHITGA
jgi:hypothetical protein